MKKSTCLKIAITFYTITLFSLEHYSQSFKKLDKAPHDIAYYRESMVTQPLVKVSYGRPSIKENEKVFGNKVPFGKIWSTGANEATEIKLYQDVKFGDKLVSAGTYVLLTIPGENEWEIILNTNLDVWGAFQYNPAADVVRIKVPVSKAEHLDVFSVGFKRKDNEVIMVLGWESTRVKIPMNLVEQAYYAKL